MKVKVIRGFHLGGKSHFPAPDDKKANILSLDDQHAKGLVASGKCEFVDKPAPVDGPMTTETVKG